MTYTTESDIEAMAAGIAALYTNKPQGWRPSPTAAAKAALAASTVHTEYEKLKAENERLREALRQMAEGDITGYQVNVPYYTADDLQRMAVEALQQKGGE